VPCKATPVWRPHPVSPYSSCTTTCRSSLLHKYCSQHQEQGETFWNWKGREVWNKERYCESVEKRETKRNEGRRRGSLKQRGRVQTHQHWRIVIFQLTIFFPRCSTIEEKVATGLRLCTGKKKKKTTVVIGLPSHCHLPNHREESSASSPPPPASSPAATALPVDNNIVRSKRRKQKQRRTGLKKKNTEKRKKKGADHRPSHSPGRHHQHLHKAAAEREEHRWQGGGNEEESDRKERKEIERGRKDQVEVLNKGENFKTKPRGQRDNHW